MYVDRAHTFILYCDSLLDRLILDTLYTLIKTLVFTF